jgi:hypothetical protein
MTLRCRLFGCKPEFRLYDTFSYGMLLMQALERDTPLTLVPHGKTICRRCGAILRAASTDGSAT